MWLRILYNSQVFIKQKNVASLGENPFGEHCIEVD